MPAVDLRKLVKEAVLLTGSVDPRKEHHELHVGIKRGHSYSSPSASPIYLPGTGQGFWRLRATLQEPIPLVAEAVANEARIRLLSGGFVTQRAPGSSLVGPESRPLDDATLARARSVLLASVFRQRDEAFDGDAFSSPRFGGVGVLTVLPNPENPKLSEDAWLHVEWIHNTSAMLSALERLAGAGLEAPTLNRRMDFLVAEEIWRSHGTVKEQVERLAHLSGVKASVHLMEKAHSSVVANQIKKAQPSRLIVLGDVDDGTVLADFIGRRGEGNLHKAEVTTAHAATEWLRDLLPQVMGVGPALIPHAPVETLILRPRLPVPVPKACAHHGQHTYVLDGESGLWWTRDLDKHGGSEFKSYTEKSHELHWNSDHNAQGDPIDKHKGPKGRKLLLSEMNSCGQQPESHIA